MAIKVQGTTVIDDSRNLQNVPNVNLTGNVYANTFIGDSSNLVNLPASGGSITATASGTLANGNKVIVNSDGTVSVISGQDQSRGTGTKYHTYGSNPDLDESRAILAEEYGGNKKVVVVYRDHEESFIVVGSVSGTSISFGSPYRWHAQNYQAKPYVLLYDSNADAVIMIYAFNTGFDRAYARAFSVNNGNSVATIGSQVEIDSTYAVGMASDGPRKIAAVYSTSSNKSYVFFSYNGGSGFLYYKSLTVNSSSKNITMGTMGTIHSGNNTEDVTACIDNTNNKIFLSYAADVRNRARVAIPNGDSLTLGTATTFPVIMNASEYGARLSVFDPVSGKVALLVLANQGNNNYNLSAVTADMGTGTSTSITFGTMQEPSIGRYVYTPTNFYHGIQAIHPNTGTIALVFQSTSNIFYFTSFKIQGSSFTTPTIPLNVSTQSGLIYASIADVPADDRFVFSYGNYEDNQGGYAEIVSALSTNLTTENFIGISDGSYANGASATVQTKGSVDDAQSSLTIGKKYYVLPDGTLSTTASTNVPVFAGTAIASNKLIVKG